MTDKKTLWNEAGKAGLALGGASIAYMACNALITVSFVNFVLWATKFAGCILLMRLFMKKFAASDDSITNSDTFRFGIATAFLSALLYSAAYLAYVQFINPDLFSSAVDSLRENPLMDSASLEAMDAMLPKMGVMSFWVNLFYCTLFGTVLSAILSRNIPSANPFAEGPADEQ